MNRVLFPTLAFALLVAGCGSKPMLSRDAFVDAAKQCGAKQATFYAATARDEPPAIQVLDTVSDINGTHVSVPNCIAVKIKDYRYTEMELLAPPPQPSR